MLKFREITPQDEKEIERLSAFASEINQDYYEPIIGPKQVAYHLEKFLSVEAMKNQLNDGYEYFVLENEGVLLGFFAFFPRKDVLYLSKFYTHKDYRGQGYGRRMLEFIKEQAKQKGFSSIELNVNRFNPTTAIYEHFGFRKIRAEQIDIGAGFIMDDFVYRLDF